MTEPESDRVLNFLPDGPGREPLETFVKSFNSPTSVADEIQSLLELDDPYIAPPEQFVELPDESLFEDWEYYVTAKTLFDYENGWLLCLPPGSDRFQTYRDIMPLIMKRHLETNFPGLKSELANRPNLFFQGVFYPDEIAIANMEMISLHHGRNYVVRCELNLTGVEERKTIVLKPASMGVEALITSIIDELNRRMPVDLRNDIGHIQVPEIVSVNDTYGILEYIPGMNGVEVLPRGINTGTIQALKSNEFPRNFDASPKGLKNIVQEIGKQAVIAYYLRLFDRKPDQMIFNPTGNGTYTITHIDFGRSIKRNYALPWKRYYATQRAPLVFDDHQIPYFEAAASLIFIPHFIPDSLQDEYPPFEGKVKEWVKKCFVDLSHFLRENIEVIREHLQYLVGESTQFNENQVYNQSITKSDITEVTEGLLSFDPTPEDAFESILNLARMERTGQTPTESETDTDSIYQRGLRSGKASRKIVNKWDGERSFELTDYKEGGHVYYNSEEQFLYIDFGRSPNRVIGYLRRHYSPKLADFITDFKELKNKVTVKIFLDGQSEIRIPPGYVRTDVDFPEQALQEVRQVVRGFSPPHHVENYITDYREWLRKNPNATFPQREKQKQRLIFDNNLTGKEVLQTYMRIKDYGDPVRESLLEVIRHLLSNPDFLVDKDPIKSINDLVVNLGHKHEFVDFLKMDDLPDDPELEPFFNSCITLFNTEIPSGHFDTKPNQHLGHIKSMVELSRVFLDQLDLSKPHRHLFLCAVLLHDLNVLNTEIGDLLLDPNTRLDRPLFQSLLETHGEITSDIFEHLRTTENLPLPDTINPSQLNKILSDHHEYCMSNDLMETGSRDSDDLIFQALHVVDTLSGFSDHSRPDHWSHGYLKFEELGARWLAVQFERNNINERLYEIGTTLFSDTDPVTLPEIESNTNDFVELHNALQTSARLTYGINPQNPGMLDELKERHDEELIENIIHQVLESGLPVEEKIKIIRRLDDLAPLFDATNIQQYVFVNASPKPIQRAVELMISHLENDSLVILTGEFPRVTKAYHRFLVNYGDKFDDKIHNVVAVAGIRRLQFIRHSYPYEADFEAPFHRIIQLFRTEKSVETNLCFIPFKNFYEGFDPAKDASSRIRQLEKASELEEHPIPERIRTETERYNKWKRDKGRYAIDVLENERLRRILLNGFTNREVLYYYIETIDERPNVSVALEEVIGALKENPNYISERTSRYSMNELVRSLSQIHFFSSDDTRGYNEIKRIATEHDFDHANELLNLFDSFGDELKFFTNTLATAAEVLEKLARPFSGLPFEEMVFSVVASGFISSDPLIHDYLLSQEDISYHKSLRRRLLKYEFNLADSLRKSDIFNSLPTKFQESTIEILTNTTQIEYGLVQSALFLSFYIDYSRIENWERGRRFITQRMINQSIAPLKRLLQRETGSTLTHRIMERIQELTADAELDFLNELAKPTYSYIYLFDALNLASELRYSLYPGGLRTFGNVRQLYGVEQTNALIDGIIESPLSVVTSLKVSRKIHYLAQGISRFSEPPTNVRFVNMDRSGNWYLPQTEASTNTIFVLTGELTNAVSSWQEIRTNNPELAERCYCLVGEEYPLLIKETTLSKTEKMKKNVLSYRDKIGASSQFMLVPCSDLLTESFIDDQNDRDCVIEPSSLFFKAWVSVFEQ